VPEGIGPEVAGEIWYAHGLQLSRDGFTFEAIDAWRQSRALFQTAPSRRRLVRPDDADESAHDDVSLPPELRPAQRPPEGAWRTWLFLGGRGAGKTLAGAAWLAERAKVETRLALVGPTLLDVRQVMIDGPSGLRGAAAAFGPEGTRPSYNASRRQLTWSNGAVASVFSAEDPDSLRGPQFGAAWADEFCAWAHPEETLAMLRLGLRLGGDPRLALTTTPRPLPALRALLAEAGCVQTRGSAADNAEHLAPGFIEGLRAQYGGTRLERQELDGEVLEAPEGALFRRVDLEAARALGAAGAPARFDRLVVAVDPPAGLHGAACGIVVAGRVGRTAWVLADRTAQGLTPLGWSSRVAEAAAWAARLGPVRVVAEANQGGEMVRQCLATGGVTLPVTLVHAAEGKRARAEPVALLYETGRVAHAEAFPALEDQLALLGAGEDRRAPSPDRADALVWALTALLLQKEREGPRISVM
jgi:phage terminase large subunit-like protein